MKKILLSACAVALAACNNAEAPKETASTDTALVKQDSEAWVPVDSATMMKNWMEYATPGDMHKMLASWEGTWDAAITSWDYEGATPVQTKGMSVNKMILGGRYLSSVHTSDMMGMAFEGHDLIGYDNASKHFVDVWVDNFGTGVMNLTGDYDASTKVLTLSGMSPDICRPGKVAETKEVITVTDDTHHKMEMYCPDPKTGKPFKMMEINSTKK